MIKVVDRENLITISNIPVPFKACTTIAVPTVGAGMLTGVLDFLFDKKLNVENINSCIDEITKDTTSTECEVIREM